MKYYVQCTKIYNGIIEVEAENENEALELAQDKLCEDTANADWTFGEATADYVENI